MRRSNLNEGTKDEILAELREFHRDRDEQGRGDKAQQYADAIGLIEAGEMAVRVGRSIYRVTDGDIEA